MILNYAIACGRLQVGNSAALEVVARRLQLIDEAVSENPSAPSWKGGRLYLGMENWRGGAFTAPPLRAFVAGEMAEECRSQGAPEDPRGCRQNGPWKGYDLARVSLPAGTCSALEALE